MASAARARFQSAAEAPGNLAGARSTGSLPARIPPPVSAPAAGATVTPRAPLNAASAVAAGPPPSRSRPSTALPPVGGKPGAATARAAPVALAIAVILSLACLRLIGNKRITICRAQETQAAVHLQRASVSSTASAGSNRRVRPRRCKQRPIPPAHGAQQHRRRLHQPGQRLLSGPCLAGGDGLPKGTEHDPARRWRTTACMAAHQTNCPPMPSAPGSGSDHALPIRSPLRRGNLAIPFNEGISVYETGHTDRDN